MMKEQKQDQNTVYKQYLSEVGLDTLNHPYTHYVEWLEQRCINTLSSNDLYKYDLAFTEYMWDFLMDKLNISKHNKWEIKSNTIIVYNMTHSTCDIDFENLSMLKSIIAKEGKIVFDLEIPRITISCYDKFTLDDIWDCIRKHRRTIN